MKRLHLSQIKYSAPRPSSGRHSNCIRWPHSSQTRRGGPMNNRTIETTKHTANPKRSTNITGKMRSIPKPSATAKETAIPTKTRISNFVLALRRDKHLLLCVFIASEPSVRKWSDGIEVHGACSAH
jgi:hypothetical protein